MNSFGGGGVSANTNRSASPMLPFGGQGTLGSVSLGTPSPMGAGGASSGSLWDSNPIMGGTNQSGATASGQGATAANTKDPFADLAGLF